MSKLKLGMVGGGQGAFIGSVHSIASRIDDHYELVAGSLASNPEVAHASAKELGINEDRSYSTYSEMAEKESNLENGIDILKGFDFNLRGIIFSKIKDVTSDDILQGDQPPSIHANLLVLLTDSIIEAEGTIDL